MFIFIVMSLTDRIFCKYFALLNFAFENWEPTCLVKEARNAVRLSPEKNFDQFREDIIILAGFYNTFWRVDGTPRIKAKSISFGSMDEIEFEKLYTATIDAIVKHVLTGYTGDSLRQVLAEVEAFE